MATEYRIDFTITRREDGDDDFTEIGFGSSGAWTDPAQAAEIAAAEVDTYQWETSGDMPDPDEIKSAVEQAKDDSL